MDIGLFFGSFNPIHNGHLIIASQIVESTSLKQIWFIVSPQNPLKKKETLLGQYDRLHLVKLAIEDDLRFKGSDIEFSLPKPSYTIDTLSFLSEKYPKHQFSLIMGADNLDNLHKWKNFESILKYFKIIIYQRPGYIIEEKWYNQPNISFCNFPHLDISSTYIRQCIINGFSLRYLVPDLVREYIETYHLFQPKKN